MPRALTCLTVALAFLSIALVTVPTEGEPLSQGTSPLPTWSSVPSYSYPAPSARSFPSLAPSEGPNGNILLFGGTGCGGFCNDTWLLGNGRGYLEWGPRYVPSPSGREGAVLVGDPDAGGALLFGGKNATAYFSDTWIFNGTFEYWHHAVPPLSPPPLAFASAAWDGDLGTMILFGGQDPSGAATDTTWSFSHGDWTSVPTASAPSPRWGASMAFDPTDGTAYLFGGTNGSAMLSDLWGFHGGNWTELSPSVSPAARAYASMTTTAGGFPLLFGGEGASGPLNDTWMYPGAGGSWQNLTPLFNPSASSPHPLEGSGLIPFDLIGMNIFLLAGGFPNATSLMDSWVLSVPSGGTPGGLQVSIELSSSNGTSPLTEEMTALASGGTPPYNFTWQFGDGSAAVAGAHVTHVFRAPLGMTFFVMVTVTDSSGHTTVSRTTIPVAASPPSPSHPGLPVWVPYAALIGGIGFLGFLASYPARSYRLARRMHSDLVRLVGDPVARPHPFPLTLAPCLMEFVRDRDLERFVHAGFQETSAWHIHLSSRLSAWFLPRRRSLLWMVDLVSSALAKVIFVVTAVFFLTEFATDPKASASAHLHGWANALTTFFSGSWLGYPVPFSRGYTTIPLAYFFASSLELILVGIALSAAISYPLGMLSGWLRGGKVDAGTRGYAAGGLFFPTIALSLLVIGWLFDAWTSTFGADTTLFAIMPQGGVWYLNHMGHVPSWIDLNGYTTPTGFPLIDVGLHGAWGLEEMVLLKTLLQGTIIALIYSAVYLRYLRLAVSEAAEEPHLVAARSRGVKERRLLWHHASRRALPLYVAAFSTTFGAFLFTEAMVEVIFADFGMGSTVFNSIGGGDPTTLVPVVYIFAVMVIFTNLIADIVVGTLDKRVITGRLVEGA